MLPRATVQARTRSASSRKLQLGSERGAASGAPSCKSCPSGFPVAALLALWLGGCSAPDGSELYAPVEGVGRGLGGAAVASGGAGGVTVSAPSGGASSGEGQGLAIARAGAGPVESSGTNSASASPDAGARDAGAASEDAAVSAEPPPCVAGLEVCDGLDNDCDGEVDPGTTCAAQCTGLALGEGSYMYCSLALPRVAAQARCEAEGMRLAWLETPEESNALVSSIQVAEVPPPAGNAEMLTQIGASDASDEGEWSWVGNAVAAGGFQFWEGPSAELGGEVEGARYAAWGAAEPNDEGGEDCAVISVLGSAIREPGQWDDRDCALQLPFLCELP